jgi:hypothetical protein
MPFIPYPSSSGSEGLWPVISESDHTRSDCEQEKGGGEPRLLPCVCRSGEACISVKGGGNWSIGGGDLRTFALRLVEVGVVGADIDVAGELGGRGEMTCGADMGDGAGFNLGV